MRNNSKTIICKMGKYTKNVNPELKSYVEEFIFPVYEENDKYDLEYLGKVMEKAFQANEYFNLGLNENMIYTTVAYHKSDRHLDKSHTAEFSAYSLYYDNNLKPFFNEEELATMAVAIQNRKEEYGNLLSIAISNIKTKTPVNKPKEYTKKASI